jgi:hypothetical protein
MKKEITMTTTEERMKILKMVQEGKITAEEGARLLEALKPAAPQQLASARRGRWLRVRVTETGSGRSKVNVNVPMRLVEAGLGIAAQYAPEEVEIGDLMNAVTEALNDGMTGKIVDVVDDEDGEHIEVFVE